MSQTFTVHRHHQTIHAFFSLSLHFFKPKHKYHYLYFEEESWQCGCQRHQALDRGTNFTTPTPANCGAQPGDVDRLRNYKTWKKKNVGWCLLSAGILTSPGLRCVSRAVCALFNLRKCQLSGLFPSDQYFWLRIRFASRFWESASTLSLKHAQ